MSGDVQPRKRKDKKKKKDELGLEEPRGTAAALGEGDLFIHSYSDHGTGGHWCAKVIFFSLLAVLVTLIGLIILENRGLSELEANAVESRYSNILEGWIEDAPDDDHHDEHTLELKHHDDEDDHYESHDVADHDEEDHDDEHDPDEHDDDEHDEEPSEEDEEEQDEEDDGQEDEEQDLEADEDEDDREPYKYDDEEEEETRKDEDEDEIEQEGQDNDEQNDDNEYEQNDDEDEQDEDNDDQNDEDDNAQRQEDESNEEIDNDVEDRNEADDEDEEDNEKDDDEGYQTREEEDEHEEHETEEDDEVEVEKIEREASEEEEPISVDLPALPEEDDDGDKDNDKYGDDDKDEADDDGDNSDEVDDTNDVADDDFLEAAPIVERVSAPAGKPFVEVEEDDVSTEAPPDTLEEEEEYEKQQEELRKEEEQSSHQMWLKLSVGAALLVATHAVLRRATAPRDEPEEQRVQREETPIDRRMTLIPEQATPPVVPKKVTQESERPVVEEMVKKAAPFVKTPVFVTRDSEEEEEDVEPELEEVVEEEIEEIDEPETLEAPKEPEKEEEKEELYSDEEEEEEEEEIVPKKEAPKTAEPPKPEPEEEDVPDDVEIIDDEQLEEELEEEEDVSDVDDAELLSRLEAKYGRLPEPERPGQKHKDGGNSVEDMWPGEPADAFWRQQLDSAERDLRQGSWTAALEKASAKELGLSARARHVIAAALDRLAEDKRDNNILTRAIDAYFDLLKMSDRLSDKKLVDVSRRTLDRIQFRGNYLKAEPVYRLLIRRFPDEPAYRNNLTISFLMSNRNDLAENVLKETLERWPNDRVALAHYGFILKTSHKDKLKEAVALFQKALEGDSGPACEPRFYYHYGDALLLLGRFEEAHEVHKRGAKLGHFLSPAQRSLYNVPRLKSRPWWNVEETPYVGLARNLERRWKEIRKEGEKAVELFKAEEEGLRERGEWSQMELFVRGQEVAGRCARAPVACGAVRGEAGAAGCRRGQVKFSAMAAGTHVRPHVGPTNCRLRMHLGLSNTDNTFIRVDQETRQWQEGKVLLFDDSFEHEVWHNGTGSRLVLIVDVWHPDLTPAERRALPPI